MQQHFIGIERQLGKLKAQLNTLEDTDSQEYEDLENEITHVLSGLSPREQHLHAYNLLSVEAALERIGYRIGHNHATEIGIEPLGRVEQPHVLTFNTRAALVDWIKEKQAEIREKDQEHIYTFKVTIELEMDIHASNKTEADDKLEAEVSALLDQSGDLKRRMEDWDYEQQADTERDDFEAMLDWVDDDEPFAVVADAGRYHLECARAVYGDAAIDKAIELSEQYSEETIIATKALFDAYPKDQDGNLLHIVMGHQWKEEATQRFDHDEYTGESCDACLFLLTEGPAPEDE